MRTEITRRLKALERRWRSIVLDLLVRLLPKRRPALPDWRARSHRLLYLRYDRIGDMILTTGILRAIKAAQPTIELHVLASPGNATILRGNRNVSSIVLFERRRWSSYPGLLWRLRRCRYDLVIDGMVLEPSLTALLMMLATGAPWRIGVGGRRNDAAYTVPVPAADPKAQAVLQSAVMAAPLGVDPATADLRPEIVLDAGEREAAEAAWRAAGAHAPGTGARLLVNISASREDRRWPEERYASALDHVRTSEPEATILVIGAPADAARVGEIARSAQVAGSTPPLRAALALVAAADCVFTPDTSIAHAASAFGKPAVVMHTQGMDVFEPYGIAGSNLYSTSDTLETLPTDGVWRALEELLRHVAASR